MNFTQLKKECLTQLDSVYGFAPLPRKPFSKCPAPPPTLPSTDLIGLQALSFHHHPRPFTPLTAYTNNHSVVATVSPPTVLPSLLLRRQSRPAGSLLPPWPSSIYNSHPNNRLPWRPPSSNPPLPLTTLAFILVPTSTNPPSPPPNKNLMLPLLMYLMYFAVELLYLQRRRICYKLCFLWSWIS